MKFQQVLPESNTEYRKVSSYDAYEQAKELSIWDHKYTQLSAGKFKGSLDEIILDSTVIFKESLNQSVLQTGLADSNAITFGFISELTSNAYYNGEIFEKPTILTIQPNQEFEFRSPLNHELYATNLNFSEFEQFINKVEQLNVWQILMNLKLINYNENVAKQLVSIFNYAHYIANNIMTEKQKELAVKDVKNSLFQCLIGCCEKNNKLKTSKINSNRIRVFHQTDAFIRAFAKEPIDIVALCEFSSTSRRTLQYCFESIVGIGPLAYLRCIRLNGVRDEIKNNKDKSISDIATDWGFWHLSNFSAYYKQMFGELPSETL